jgi:hypothetical protein
MYKVSKANDLVSGKEFSVTDNVIKLDIDGSKYFILKLEKQ